MSSINRRTFLRRSTAAAIALGIGARGWQDWEGAVAATTSIDPAALKDLRARLNGTLILPGESAYATASAPANGRYLNIRPAAVARCADEADVVTCVKWCNENGVSPVVRAGGHSYAGFCTTTELLIDLRRLNAVQVDRRQGMMTTGGATLNGDYFIAHEDGPLFLPGGTCLGVGVGGLTLGGGIGYNAHWAGLTCDHLLASRIVTAAGEVLDINDATNSDLFWACRGGAGGTFGINTAFTFKLVEVPQANVSYYRFDWRGADAAAAVLSAFNTLIAKAPPALNAVAMAQASEVGSGGPREAIDVFSRGQYVGPIDELRDLVRPLLAAAPSIKQVIKEMAFWDLQRFIGSEEPEPHSFGDISRYAADPVPDSAVAAMIDLLAACPSRSADANGSIWSLGWVGGIVNAIPRTATAYVHRNMSTLLRPTTVWPNDAPPSVADGLNAWSAAMIAAIAPYTPAESYQNFPNRSLADWQQLYYAENFERLVDVKTKYDKGNLFNNAQSIPPRSLPH